MHYLKREIELFGHTEKLKLKLANLIWILTTREGDKEENACWSSFVVGDPNQSTSQELLTRNSRLVA